MFAYRPGFVLILYLLNSSSFDLAKDVVEVCTPAQQTLAPIVEMDNHGNNRAIPSFRTISHKADLLRSFVDKTGIVVAIFVAALD